MKKKKIDFKVLLNKISRYAARKEVSSFDIARYLQRYAVSEKEKEKIFLFLQKNRFWSEERYIKAYIHDKLTIQRWGKKKIFHKLLEKKISPLLIEQCWNECVDHEEYIRYLQNLLQKRWPPKDACEKKKLYQYLLRRGFETDDIHYAIDRLTDNE